MLHTPEAVFAEFPPPLSLYDVVRILASAAGYFETVSSRSRPQEPMRRMTGASSSSTMVDGNDDDIIIDVRSVTLGTTIRGDDLVPTRW